MMKEFGTVTEVKDGMAYVYFKRTSMCAKCGACGMAAGQSDITVTTKNNLDARPGDRVELEFTSKNALTSSMIAYIFPLIMLFVGVWIGYSLPQPWFDIQDVMAAIMGLVFVAAAFVIIKLLNPLLKKRFANVYTMVRIGNEKERVVKRDVFEEDRTQRVQVVSQQKRYRCERRHYRRGGAKRKWEK